MSVGPKVRFEVFKRDDFSCRYCGRKTPVVVLEVDHVIPIAEGGDDDPANLVTSCFDCNRGKGRILLDDNAPVEDIHERTILLLERERQLREYSVVRKAIREREDADIEDLLAFWLRIVPYIDTENRLAPQPRSLRKFLCAFTAEDIKDAIEIALEKVGPWGATAYTFGILSTKIRERPVPRA